MRIPCVATNVGACSSLLYGKDKEDEKLGNCGIVTRVHSPYETAESIVKILSNPELYKQMSEAGKIRIKNNYQRKDIFNLYRREINRFLMRDGKIVMRNA